MHEKLVLCGHCETRRLQESSDTSSCLSFWISLVRLARLWSLVLTTTCQVWWGSEPSKFYHLVPFPGPLSSFIWIHVSLRCPQGGFELGIFSPSHVSSWVYRSTPLGQLFLKSINGEREKLMNRIGAIFIICLIRMFWMSFEILSQVPDN